MRKHYHFIGIGGIGMSGLAQILLSRGERVSGSDISRSALLDFLREKGALIHLNHSAENLQDVDAVVYSSDIPENNPEYQKARENHIPIYHRSELLAYLMEGYAPLLVTGTHGKTTTSSLLAHVLVKLGLDPCYAVGGIIRGLGSNARHGKGVYFAAEADESDGSFLKYPSFGAIITNLDKDHLSYWGDEESLNRGFVKFAGQVGSRRHLFWCKDDPRLQKLQLEGYSYGFDEKADFKIENFEQHAWKSFFDLSYAGKVYREIEIPLIGAHNVLNASAVLAMTIKLDLPIDEVRKALLTFEGIGRRVEKKGSFGSIDFYDDYAHHPTEIFATLRALKNVSKGRRMVVVFQPHRYSRTKECLDEFPEAFEYADQLIVTDIYAAREAPSLGITTDAFVKKLKETCPIPTHYASRDELAKFVSKFVKEDDFVVTMGAGDVTYLGQEVLNELNQHIHQ